MHASCFFTIRFEWFLFFFVFFRVFLCLGGSPGFARVEALDGAGQDELPAHAALPRQRGRHRQHGGAVLCDAIVPRRGQLWRLPCRAVPQRARY